MFVESTVPPKSEDKYVFVYGTLKFGYQLHNILVDMGARYVGETTIPNSHLRHLGAFPALMMTDEGESNWAQGEIWAIEYFHVLDSVEGVPSFYQRDVIAEAKLPDGNTALIESYHQTSKKRTMLSPLVLGGEWNAETAMAHSDGLYGFKTVKDTGMSTSRRSRMDEGFDHAMREASKRETAAEAEADSGWPYETGTHSTLQGQADEHGSGFRAWMIDVDICMTSLVGLGTADIADFDFYSAYADRTQPSETARDALRNDSLGAAVLADLGL